MHHRHIFGSSLRVFGNLWTSSGIFGNSQKMFGIFRLVFGTILESLRKSSESGRKSSENHQKRRHQYVYIIKRTLHVSSKIWILCSRGKNNILIKFIISYLLRFSDRIDRMKNSYGNFFIQSQSGIDFLTRWKSRFTQSEISCQNESVSSQIRSRCFWRLFNLHSQKFVAFPQVYLSILENLP